MSAPDTSRTKQSAPSTVDDADLRRRLGLTEQEMQEFREIFQLVDLDHGGTIDSDELGQLLFTLGIRPSPAELDNMIKEIDPHGEGEISFEAFVTAMMKQKSNAFKPDELKHAFRIFARQDPTIPPGFIQRSVLEKALVTYGTEKMTLDEAREVLDQLTTTPDGLINYAEIVNIMT